MSQTSFPWLMTNVVDNETGKQLAEGLVHHVMDWEGRKVGILGLVEREWLDTLATINDHFQTVAQDAFVFHHQANQFVVTGLFLLFKRLAANKVAVSRFKCNTPAHICINHKMIIIT